MSDRNDSQFGAFLATFLAGAALGAVVVALTTPKTGAQLREDLADLLDDLRKQVPGSDPQA
jgi:gas vesicle protein